MLVGVKIGGFSMKIVRVWKLSWGFGDIFVRFRSSNTYH